MLCHTSLKILNFFLKKIKDEPVWLVGCYNICTFIMLYNSLSVYLCTSHLQQPIIFILHNNRFLFVYCKLFRSLLCNESILMAKIAYNIQLIYHMFSFKVYKRNVQASEQTIFSKSPTYIYRGKNLSRIRNVSHLVAHSLTLQQFYMPNQCYCQGAFKYYISTYGWGV